MFSADFEVNPLHVEADMALRLSVQPVEVVYDEVCTHKIIVACHVIVPELHVYVFDLASS